MNPRNVGELLLTRLKSLGVENFFANPGTEFISVIRGFHELPEDSVPTPVSAPHESLAVNMAYGCYLASGRPQALMTHANVGAANALIGLIGASRMNIPLIFIAGLTSRSERGTAGHRDKLIHWSQDAKDPGAMFREYMKWEAEISDPETAADIIDRAFTIAMTPPFGPVAIKICRDILVSEKISARASTPAVSAGPAPSPSALSTSAGWLAASKRPLVLTNRLGADPAAVSLLSEISGARAIPVVTPEDFYMSFPAGHPYHLGYSNGQALAEADLVLVLDTEAPWFPLEKGPAPGAKVIQIGPDPLFADIPLRGHRADLFITSTAGEFLAAVRRNLHPLAPGILEMRKEWIAGMKTDAAEKRNDKFDARAVSKIVSGFLDESTILINELSLLPEELGLRWPGQYFRSGSASPLGWGVGCALGISLARENKTVIAAIGDGVFFLSPVHGALALSVQKHAPFITIVLNNGGMASITKAARDFYPDLPAKLPLASFPTQAMQIEKCAEAFGGLGLRAKNGAELTEGLKTAAAYCRENRRPALINVILD